MDPPSKNFMFGDAPPRLLSALCQGGRILETRLLSRATTLAR